MELNCYKINPTGNVTLIVEGAVPVEQQAALAAELMKRDTEAEQVGFLSKPQRFGSAAALRMMGGEFCGNAAISAAALGCRRAAQCRDREAFRRTVLRNALDAAADGLL